MGELLWLVVTLLGILVGSCSGRENYNQEGEERNLGQTGRGYYYPGDYNREGGIRRKSSGSGGDYGRTVIRRRSDGQGQGSYYWEGSNNDYDLRPTTHKPRRTHYGQTGSSTLTRFFDSTKGTGNAYQASDSSSNSMSSSRRNKVPSPGRLAMSRDSNNRVQMGVANDRCDDAKTNLTIDWDGSPVNHTCYHPEVRFPRDPNLSPVMHCDRIPPRYVPGHVCMDHRISYTEGLPTHGDHRPLWPVFGEYVFVPRERWLHNIEHGAVVMLYHPCAHPTEVNKLKMIVKGCFGKHIITPSTFVPPERPLALIAWGCRLLMANVDEADAVRFIETRGMRGPEGTYTKEGQYTYGLLETGQSVGTGAKYGYSKIKCSY